jgi:hypothetical protein
MKCAEQAENAAEEAAGNFKSFVVRQGCVTSFLIAIQDFLVSGFRFQVSGVS